MLETVGRLALPYFAKLDRGHVMFDDPIVVQGERALHLRYMSRAG
jgi:hypothetical protein